MKFTDLTELWAAFIICSHFTYKSNLVLWSHKVLYSGNSLWIMAVWCRRKSSRHVLHQEKQPSLTTKFTHSMVHTGDSRFFSWLRNYVLRFRNRPSGLYPLRV